MTKMEMEIIQIKMKIEKENQEEEDHKCCKGYITFKIKVDKNRVTE